MSDETTVQSDEKPAQSGDESQENNETPTRSAEDLAKRLKEVSQEAKQYRQKNAELKRQIEEKSKTQLQENGQYKELAELWQRKATESETREGKLKQAFGIKTISDSIAVEAAKMGCIDTDAIFNLLPLDQVPVDEMFNVDRNTVKVMLDDFRKQKPYFFAKPAPKIANGAPGKPDVVVGKPLEKMTSQEIQTLLKEKFKK